MLAHILVPTDGSPTALLAAQLGEALAADGGSLTLLHVSDPPLTATAAFDAAAAVIGGAMGNLANQEALANSQEGARVLASRAPACRAARWFAPKSAAVGRRQSS